jgi:type IV pilus assembly protein PilW
VADADENDSDGDLDYPGGFPGFVAAGKDTIRFTMDYMPDTAWCKDGQDNDGDGSTDELDECYSNGTITDASEDITYSLDDTKLMRDDANDGKDPQVLAYDIEAVAFAYAFDSDDDRQLDTDGATPVPNVIWAYDSDGDGDLDYDVEAGGALATEVPISAIRAVKIWLLARTASPIRDYSDTQTYSVGGQSLTKDDHYKRTLLTTSVYCRNTRF